MERLRKSNPELARQIGQRLRQLRAERNLTQEDVEDRSALRVAILSRAEGGKVMPTLVTLAVLADVYEVDLADIIDPGRPVPQPALTDREGALLGSWRRLSPEGRDALQVVLDELTR